MLVAKRTIDLEEKWVITYFNNYHNHDLLDDKEVQFLPAYRNIPIADQSRILLLSKAGCAISLITRVLELEKGIDTGSLPFLDKDIRNFIQSQSSIGKENDASDVLKLCKSLKDIDDDFKYEFTIDENNKLEHIIWAFGDSIRAYETFGDVVVFDTTYRINRYDMPLGLWVGVDNHGNSIFFGCVLLRDEKIPSFTWALKNFLAFVQGKYPKTILTDQDLALKEAIAMELPNTKHAFCIWHIVSKLSSWFSFALGSRYNDFKQEFHRVYHLGCGEDFEREWQVMVAEFGLLLDRHIELLFSHRKFWALAYLKDFFFAGMTTTGRSESINAYIKRFLDAKTSLTDFVNQVGVAVKIRNQAGEEARMRQKYHNPHIRTCFPIEEHAASVLTPYAFDLLQHEIELSTKYAATEIDNSSYIVKHHTKDDGGRLTCYSSSNS
ncbi:protein FAR1-related sequence 11-like [Trifolium pratense]|uniref:Protein FAR1-RELATED SEQUENCE n=1 Tax=Trifolium pratense TaxID=57577 RepID=A0A2K3L0W0_TRIPR|nr:protein FAR1-related sequence 11-like [Trifolium pratense]